MDQDQIFRVMLMIGAAILLPIMVYHQVRSRDFRLGRPDHQRPYTPTPSPHGQILSSHVLAAPQSPSAQSQSRLEPHWRGRFPRDFPDTSPLHRSDTCRLFRKYSISPPRGHSEKTPAFAICTEVSPKLCGTTKRAPKGLAARGRSRSRARVSRSRLSGVHRPGRQPSIFHFSRCGVSQGASCRHRTSSRREAGIEPRATLLPEHGLNNRSTNSTTTCAWCQTMSSRARARLLGTPQARRHGLVSGRPELVRHQGVPVISYEPSTIACCVPVSSGLA